MHSSYELIAEMMTSNKSLHKRHSPPFVGNGSKSKIKKFCDIVEDGLLSKITPHEPDSEISIAVGIMCSILQSNTSAYL